MKDLFLAWDHINGDHEYFDTIEEAREWLQESFVDDYEGYHPDAESCKIYKLYEEVVVTTIDSKENYKYESEDDAIEADDQEALDKEDYWTHPSEFDFIAKHEFVKIQENETNN